MPPITKIKLLNARKIAQKLLNKHKKNVRRTNKRRK
jgi:hypothetical protein